jgi:large subunit ribosomal protein L28
VTKRGVQTGNNVSHANNKTRRRFLPNLQNTSLLSDALSRSIRMRVTPRGIRTIEANGGLDAWLLSSRDEDLTPAFRRLKKQVVKARARAEASAG